MIFNEYKRNHKVNINIRNLLMNSNILVKNLFLISFKNSYWKLSLGQGTWCLKKPWVITEEFTQNTLILYQSYLKTYVFIRICIICMCMYTGVLYMCVSERLSLYSKQNLSKWTEIFNYTWDLIIKQTVIFQ